MTIAVSPVVDVKTGTMGADTKKIAGDMGAVKISATDKLNKKEGGSMWDFLDELGSKAVDFAGRAVDATSDKLINDMKESKNPAPDSQGKVMPDALASGTAANAASASFFARNKWFIAGGAALALVGLVLMVRK